MVSQEALEKMVIRQEFSNLWHTDLMDAIADDPSYCCFATLCPHCVSYLLRKRALYNDMSRYTCCGGYMPCSGKCGERKCPELCLCTEVFLCFANSVASTRFMLQDEFNIQTTQCDNCIIGFMFCLQQLACIFSIAACLTGIDELEEASQLLSCLSDLVYCSVCSCMQTQHKREMDKRDGKFGPQPIMAPPSPQHMSRIDQAYPPPSSGYPPPPAPPVYQQMYGYPPPAQPYAYPPPAPGYPASSSPGYPASSKSPPGYPASSPPGYPAPPPSGYPPSGYPAAPPSGYPASSPPGYPAPSPPGYPQHSPDYPPNPPAYPANHPGYPQHSPDYSPNPPAYPANPPGYPQHSPNYPPNPPNYPPNPPAYPANPPGYPPHSPGYPTHSPSYPGPGADYAPPPPKSDSK